MDPAAFTTPVMRAAQALGTQLREGAVTGVTRRGSAVTGVEVDVEALLTEALVVAMGPWSVLAARWLPVPAVYPDKGHSLISTPEGRCGMRSSWSTGTRLGTRSRQSCFPAPTAPLT
jgi:glycine/D-amino acid oxidase-like deaminating enzyme